MPPRVLVTRAELEPLGALLRARGLEPVHLPLLALVPTGAPPPGPAPGQVLVSSAVALAHAPGLVAWIGGARVIAVGAATAEALRQAGLARVEVGAGGGEEALALLHPGPACFVGARRPAPALARALAEGRLSHWAVYDRAQPVVASAPLPDLALVTLCSPSAAEAWAAMGQPELPVLAIGSTSAAAARALGLPLRGVAAQPSLEALAQAAATLLGMEP